MTTPQMPDSLSDRRSPLLAGVLSFIAPGVGQYYAGASRRAIAWAIVFIISVPVTVYGIATVPSLVLVLLIAAVAVRVLSSWDAVRVARTRAPDSPAPRWFFLLAAALGLGLVSGLTVAGRGAPVLAAFRIPTASMSPTLDIGDFIFVDRRLHPVEINEPIVFRSTEDASLLVLKRIAGLPGDTLAMKGGALFRNGQRVTEPYVIAPHGVHHAEPAMREKMAAWQRPVLVPPADTAYAPDLNDWGPLVVPLDNVFTLGDNRDSSYDSRYTGPLPISRVWGRPLSIYWSWAANYMPRWSRIGQRIQ
jgi:signal peptidase I